MEILVACQRADILLGTTGRLIGRLPLSGSISPASQDVNVSTSEFKSRSIGPHLLQQPDKYERQRTVEWQRGLAFIEDSYAPKAYIPILLKAAFSQKDGRSLSG